MPAAGFGRVGLFRPENIPRTFVVYKPTVSKTATGRVRFDPITDPETQQATGTDGKEYQLILSYASQTEIQRFAAQGITVDSVIIQRGGDRIAEQNDIFALIRGGTERRYFRVQSVHNKGELDIFTVYYCEERSDRSL